MSRKPIACAAIAVLIASSACDSDDDAGTIVSDETGRVEDDTATDEETQGETPIPDTDREPERVDLEPSGSDTSVVAGLWDAGDDTSARRDERYVNISADGLYTDYDLLDDGAASEGNCYVATPMQMSGVFAVHAGDGVVAAPEGSEFFELVSADRDELRLLAASVDGEARTLTVTFYDDALEADETQTWSAVDGIVASDLPVCGD